MRKHCCKLLLSLKKYYLSFLSRVENHTVVNFLFKLSQLAACRFEYLLCSYQGFYLSIVFLPGRRVLMQCPIKQKIFCCYNIVSPTIGKDRNLCALFHRNNCNQRNQQKLVVSDQNFISRKIKFLIAFV